MKNIDIPNYKLTDSQEHPTNVDYDLFGLHKKRTFDQGELNLVEYYRNFDGTTYSDLVLKEQRVFERNELRLVVKRTQTTTWYLDDISTPDDNPSPIQKITEKFYSNQEAMSESETRRKNLMDDAKLFTVGAIADINSIDFLTAEQNALDFMQSINNEISLFIQGKFQNLFDAIQASTKPYLNQWLKDELVTILTIVYPI